MHSGGVASGLSAHSAKFKCRIGARAGLHIRRIAPGDSSKTHLLTPVTIIGCGRGAGDERVEVVAYATDQGFCYAIDHLAQKASGGGLCKPDTFSWEMICRKALCVNGLGIYLGASPGYSELSGEVSSDVATAIVRYRLRGQVQHSRKALVTHVDGKLMEQLKQKEPMGVLSATLQPCVVPGSIVVTVFNDAGQELESGRPMTSGTSRPLKSGCGR